MKNNKAEKTKRRMPYGLVIFLSLLATGAIIYAMVKVAVVEAPQWNEKADKMWKLDKMEVAVPHRGDILAHDGTPLAQTVALYTVFVYCFCRLQRSSYRYAHLSRYYSPQGQQYARYTQVRLIVWLFGREMSCKN